jgi:uncharacterized protein (DUF58 family)
MNWIYRFLYRGYRLGSGLRYRALRRLTPAGLAVLAAWVVSGMMGPDTDNNVAYQGFTLLFCLLLLGWIFSWRFRARFTATRQLPKFGTVGLPLVYSLRLSNLSPKSQTGLSVLENLADPRPSFDEWVAHYRAEQKQARPFRLSQSHQAHPFRRAVTRDFPVPTAPSLGKVDVPMELTPSRRGILRFNGLTLVRCDPLGLFRSCCEIPAPQSVLILPKRYRVPPLNLPGTMKYQEGGVVQASNVGQSDEFVALRDYRHGDPVRHIHWRSWARTGKPVVKEFEDEFFLRHALVLDTFIDHSPSPVLEEAVSVAASFAWTVQTQESLLDLLFVGSESYCFTAGRGLAHADQMLEILASVQPCRERPFERLESLVVSHIGAVSGCICVLLAWDNARREFVTRLRSFGVPLLVMVVVNPRARGGMSLETMNDASGPVHVLKVGEIEQGLARIR